MATPRVALNDAFAGRHLRTLVVGAIALAHRAFCSASVVGVPRQPRAKVGRVAYESLPSRGVLRRQGRLDLAGIFGPMPCQHRLGGALHLLRLSLEVGPGAAAVLRGIAGQLDPVDGEHLAADQPLAVTDGEHGGEDRRDLIAQGRYEVRDGREVGPGIAAQGDERDVFLAGPGDRAAAHDPAGVGEPYDPQQHGRCVGRRAGRVIPIPRIERGQVDGVLEQVVQRMLERARQELRGEVDRDQLGLEVDGLVARHGDLSTRDGTTCTFSSRPTLGRALGSVSTSGWSASYSTAPLARRE